MEAMEVMEEAAPVDVAEAPMEVVEAPVQTTSAPTSLSLAVLEDIQADCLADDVPIDYEVMRHWSEKEVRNYFHSGGQDEPGTAAAKH